MDHGGTATVSKARRAASTALASRPGLAVRRSPTEDRLLPNLVGRSPAWRRVREQAIRSASSSRPLLVTGEAGVGKAALARAMHADADAAGRLAMVDAGLLPLEGTSRWLNQVRAAALDQDPAVLVIRHLEALDDLAAFALASVLDEQRECHPAIRWVATMTPPPLATATASSGSGAAWSPTVRAPLCGLARLIDRIGHGRIEIPPLRDRPDDIPLLVEALSGRYTPYPGRQYWTAAALQVLTRLAWTGNVRQLEAVVARIVEERQGGPVERAHLPVGMLKEAAFTLTSGVETSNPLHVTAVYRAAIIAALHEAGRNKAAAARRLGISRSTLYRQLSALHIDDE